MKSKQQKTLFLIDGSSFLYRAYYGLRPLHTAKGEPVQAVYGFCTMLKKLIEKFKPHYLALVWDSKGKTTRHELFEDYKATRQAPPSDLFEQKEWIVDIAKAIDLHQLQQDGIEADDLMYSLAQEWQQDGGDVVVITSDKDMGQMITSSCQMFDSFKEQMIDTPAFEAKMGFPVVKAPFYFALLGDSSDNIPGVKGIGKKGALELVTQFESLKDVYANLDTIKKPRIKNALEANKENAFLSEKLFLLQYHKTGITQEQLEFNPVNWSKAKPIFHALQFKSLLKSLGDVQTSPIELVKSAKSRGYNFQLVSTQEQLDNIVAEIKKRKLFAYDTEGNGTHPLAMDMVGMSICYQNNESFYIACGHDSDQPQLSRELVIETLKPVFEDVTIEKIAHHAKFDELVLYHYGIVVKGPVFDTMLAATLVKQDWQKATLKACSQHYLNEPMFTFKQMVEDKKRKHFGQVPLDEATEYGAADSHQTFRLYPIFKKLLQEKQLEELYYKIEIPTMQVLTEMEAAGIYCDVAVLKELDTVVTKKIDAIREKILNLVGPEFNTINLNSPQQIEILLFEHLKLPPKKKSSRRDGYSTDNEVLVELAKEHPVPGYIAQYRELAKLKSTYIDALPTFINPETGRIHTTYSQNRVATGRLASSDPNMQNIPVEGLGSTVRAAFKPQEGRIFLSADYSQIELRVLAHLSRDEMLTNAFLQGRDIHKQTAAGIFKIDINEVTDHQRQIGKRINFSILYGLTPFGLSKDLVISQKDAKQYIDDYFAHYPKVRIWMDKIIEQAKKDEYVTTWHGRRREVPGINERNKNLAELAKRIAVNTVAQGTAAEIMKLGMIAVAKELKRQKLDACILLQIHDELLLSVKESEIDTVRILVKNTLESVVNWKVPLVVNTSTGHTWKEAK